jgi:8-amino-7-oxononanoate synthase
LLTSTPHALSNFLLQKGYIVRPVVPPTVPPGGERVRICLRAGMRKEVVEGLVDAIGEWVEGRVKEVRGTKGGSGLVSGEVGMKAKL